MASDDKYMPYANTAHTTICTFKNQSHGKKKCLAVWWEKNIFGGDFLTTGNMTVSIIPQVQGLIKIE